MTDTRVAELINQNNFVDILKNELYSLIDEELAKDIDMDCDLVDELVNAIEALEQCEDENPAVVLPIIFADGTILSKRIRNKVNGRKTFMRITAVAAAFAIILSGANQIPTTEGKSVLVYAVDEILEGISEIFGIKNLLEKEETPVTPEIEESTTLPDEEIGEQNNNENPQSPIQMVSLNLITYSKFKTSYLWKEELDLTGLKVVVVYSDDTEKTIPVSDCEISGFNSLKMGEQTVTVKYKGLSAHFKVTVSKTEQNNEATRQITNVECNSANKDIIVPKGTENPAVYKNVQYRYVYSDSTFSPWTTCKDAELISEYNSELLDTPQALTYRAPNGMEFTINVIVYDNTVPEEKTVTKLEVYKTPTAMKHYASNYDQYYMYVDDECDFSEFKIKVYFSDNTTETKTLGDSEIKTFGTISTERPSSYSGYTITFAYGDVTTTFKYEVIVKPEIQSYCFDEVMWDCYYINDAPEEFNTKGIVKAKMTDSNKEIYLDVEAKGYDPNKIGYIELEIYYEGEYLGNYTAGYIYGDTGYAVTDRPATSYTTTPPFSYRPSVRVAKCVGDGKFETYGDIKYELDDKPITNSKTYLESGVNSELSVAGITKFECWCEDSATVYYTVRSDFYIKEFGAHQAKVYLYNVTKQDNGSYVKADILQDLSYNVTIKEQPTSYIFEAPNNIKINIQDIYTEFYDKVHVYAVYKDGRKEEVFDYYISRYLPSSVTTSSCLRVYMRSADWERETFRNVYVYSEGYEDSFFINLKDKRKEYDNYYLVGTSKPSVQIDFASAEQSQIEYCSTNDSDDGELWSIEGWDTSTPGEKTATIIYHSPIGDLKTTYKYIVISEYNTNPIQLTFTNGQEAYDVRYGFIDGTYEIKFIDVVGRFYDLTDYTISYNQSIWSNGQYFIPVLNYTSPVDNKKYKFYFDKTERVGEVKSVSAQRLENGDVKITVETLYTPQNGYLKYRFYICGKYVYADTDSNIAEVIIPKDQWAEGNSKTYNLTAYIIDDESGEWYISREYQQAKVTIE